MNSSRRNSSVPDAAPPSAPSIPPSIGYGHPEHNFVVGLLEIQKQLGEMNANILALSKTVDSVKSKVDILMEWKAKIAGGIIVLGILCTLIGIGITKFSTYFTFKVPEESHIASAPSATKSSPAPVASDAKR